MSRGHDGGGHVFISYARGDAKRVDQLQERLQAAGITVWRDTSDLWPGQDWRLEIRRAIADGVAFIACFSDNTAGREATFQNEELVMAVEEIRRRPPGSVWLLPVRFSACRLPQFDLGAGRSLLSLQWVDLFDDVDWDPHVARLISKVREMKGASDVPAPAGEARRGEDMEAAATLSSADAATDRHFGLVGSGAQQLIPQFSQPDSADPGMTEVEADFLAADAIADDSCQLPDHSEPIGAVGLVQESLRIAYSIEAGKGRILARAISLLGTMDPGQAASCLDDALRAAYSIGGEAARSATLLDIADLLVSADPDRANRLRADAERIAESIGDEAFRSLAAVDLALRLTETDPARASRLRAEADRTTRSITRPWAKLRALCDLAERVAGPDPDWAARLLEEAERELQSDSIPEDSRREALCDLAKRVAESAPDWAARLQTKAERAAESLSSDSARSKALREIADQVSNTDPEWATHLRLKAERAAQSISDESARSSALSDLAREFAASDPGHSERILMSISDEACRSKTLNSIAESLAASDPERAERVAQLLADKPQVSSPADDHSNYVFRYLGYLSRNDTLRKVMRVLVSTDPRRAERIARSSPDDSRSEALADVAKWLAVSDPDHAERVAQSAPYTSPALAGVAQSLAATDPERAERIARSISNDSHRYSALAKVAESLAVSDVEHAERIVKSIPDKPYADVRSTALNRIAEVLAVTNPTRAQYVAESISDPHYKALALYNVAQKLAKSDPKRAASLLVHAGQVADRSTSSTPAGPLSLNPSLNEFLGSSRDAQESPLHDILTALADVAPAADAAVRDEAKLAAKELADKVGQVLALAGTDPDEAERASRSITDKPSRAAALRGIAEAVAVIDQDRAARLNADAERLESDAQALKSKSIRYAPNDRAATFVDTAERLALSMSPSALGRIAVTVAATDPDRAERVAQSIPIEFKASALFRIALTLADVDPDRAERVAQSIPDQAGRVALDIILWPDLPDRGSPTTVSALRKIAQTVAGTDPARAVRVLKTAERVAWSISDQAARAVELLQVAECWLAIGSEGRNTEAQ